MGIFWYFGAQKPKLAIILNFQTEDEFQIFSKVLFLMLLLEFAQHWQKKKYPNFKVTTKNASCNP